MSPPEPDSPVRPYELLDVVGTGGQGEVYRARFTGRGGFARIVAIKVLSQSAGSSEELGQRLRDEARILSRLQHRGIVQVLDLTVIDGRWAVVMELVEGSDLRQILLSGAIPPRTACEILAEVASALGAAHAAVDPDTRVALGVVHRDVKPHNIRITPGGSVKLLDFGISHASFAEREAVTRSLYFGTDGYLSPERFDRVTGPFVDVYALGVVGWEMLCGRPLGSLGVSPARHGVAVQEALDQLPEEAWALRPLLASALAHAAEARPSADEWARQARALIPHVPGPWLAEWASGAVQAANAAAHARRAAESKDASAEGRAANLPKEALGSAPTLRRGERGESLWPSLPEPPPPPPLPEPPPLIAGREGLPAGSVEATGVVEDVGRTGPQPVSRPDWVVPVVAASLLGGTAFVLLVGIALHFAPSRGGVHELPPVVIRSLPPAEISQPAEGDGGAASVGAGSTLHGPVDGPPQGGPAGANVLPPAGGTKDAGASESSPGAVRVGDLALRPVPPARKSAPASARVDVGGDARAVRLSDGHGGEWPAGVVPEGTYSVVAVIGERPVTLPAPLTVSAGDTWTIRCDQLMENCTTERK